MKNFKSPRAVFVRSNRTWLRVNIDDITYIESCGDYVQWKGTDSKGKEQTLCLSDGSLDKVCEQLAPYGFLRIHRKYALSVERIEDYDGQTVVVGSHVLPVSRQKRKWLVDQLCSGPLAGAETGPVVFPETGPSPLA